MAGRDAHRAPRRSRLASRLDQLQVPPPPEAVAAPRRRVPPVVWLALAVLAAAVWLLHRSAAAPPAALAQTRLGDAPVRLVAISTNGPYRYVYQPPAGLARRLFPRAGDAPVDAAAELPEKAFCLWLWIAQPALVAPDGASVSDDQGRTYENHPQREVVRADAVPWGRATLVWVALTDFDRTARELRFQLSFGTAGTMQLAVAHHPEPPATWPIPRSYPVVGGDETATIRLWHLRRVDPVEMADTLAAEAVPQPYDELLVADLDVVEPGGGSPGSWRIEATEALTAHGERLTIVHQRAGLVFLTAGRDPSELGAVQLGVAARKIESGSAVLVYQHLELPAQVGEVSTWNREAAKPAPLRLVCLRGARLEPGLVRFTFQAEAPEGGLAQLEYVGGLDDQGEPIEADDEEGLKLAEQSRRAGREVWRWSLLARVRPDAKAAALACRLLHRTVIKQTQANLVAEALPARGQAELAAIGVLLQPVRLKDSTNANVTFYKVAAPVAGSRAERGPLKPGDLLVSIDDLPPALLPRVLLRHGPGDAVPVLYRRAGKLYRGRLTLDRRGATRAPEGGRTR